MAKDSKRKYVPRPEDTQTLLKKELHRRGMGDGEIVSTLRKKKRDKMPKVALARPRHAVPRGKIRLDKSALLKAAPTRPRLADELCTVEFAAKRLKVHQKTILRLIRKARLKGTRIGKAYRILRSDLEAFAGVEMPAAPSAASVTSVVDVPDVAPETAQKWSQMIMAALNARANHTPPLRAETIYEPERAHFKVVIVGAPSDTMNLLGLVRMWAER